MIIIDTREKRSYVPKKLQDWNIPITFSVLEVGDYVCVGKENVVVSRKEVHDYVGSLTSGHLNNELYDMSRNYPYAILIVEGFVSEALMYRKLKRYNFFSSLVGSTLKRAPEGRQGVISVLCAETPFDTALILKFIHDKVTEEEGLIRKPVLQAIRWKPEERTVAILAAFEGVGEKRAQDILKHFGTLKAVCEASVEELMEVKGIGRRIAESIYNTWRSQWKGG